MERSRIVVWACLLAILFGLLSISCEVEESVCEETERYYQELIQSVDKVDKSILKERDKELKKLGCPIN